MMVSRLKMQLMLIMGVAICLLGCASRRLPTESYWPNDLAVRMSALCEELRSHDKAWLAQAAREPAKWVWESNGLYAFVVYELTHPQTLLLHPFRPFIVSDKKLQFANVPKPYGDYPLVELARQLGSQKEQVSDSTHFVHLKGRATSLGFYRYIRDYHGVACSLRSGERVVLATATMPVRRGLGGSNLARVSGELLSSDEMSQVLEVGPANARYREILQAVSRRFALEVSDGVADALGLPPETIKTRLMQRVEEDDHLARFIASMKVSHQASRYTILGFLLSDLEHTMAEMSLSDKSPVSR